MPEFGVFIQSGGWLGRILLVKSGTDIYSLLLFSPPPIDLSTVTNPMNYDCLFRKRFAALSPRNSVFLAQEPVAHRLSDGQPFTRIAEQF
jgi:hypothetical protein